MRKIILINNALTSGGAERFIAEMANYMDNSGIETIILLLRRSDVHFEINKKIKIIEPVSFLDMIRLESECNLISTDSGGVQKESYFFKKPCVILRNETEWVELVDAGTAIIAGADSEKIIAAYQSLKTASLNFPPIFGDGKAGDMVGGCGERCNQPLALLSSLKRNN